MYKPRVSELGQLVGNPDAYATQREDGGWTPVREPLSMRVLRAHRKGEVTVGTYIVSKDQARTLVFDIDHPSGAVQREMLGKVRAVLDTLYLPYLVEYSGGKGYHVWVVAEEFMPAATLYQLGRGVRTEAELPQMEVFPKQTTVRDLGNLVKLPGGFHAVTGNANDLLDVDDDPVTGPGWPENLLVKPEYLEKLAGMYPEPVRVGGGAVASVEYPCVHRIQEGVETNRNIHLYHLAAMLRRWSLSEENVETIIRRANERSAEGGLDEDELASILERPSSGPLCHQLDEDVHCGDQCFLTKRQGLWTRSGTVAHAALGEKIVVEVSSRTDEGRIMEVVHPDIEVGRISLKAPAPKGKKRDD